MDDGTILILGASGFLGAHLLKAARRAGHDVVAACRRPEGAPASSRAATSRWRRVDLAALETVEPFLDDVAPTRVVLCAAMARPADCEREPDAASRTNARAPAAVARWCRRSGARLVHVSTDLVFGGEPPRPEGYRESDAADPVSAYGRTKADGERAVLDEDPAALVVRLPLLFGDSLGRGLGASDSLLATLDAGETPHLFEDEWRTPLDASLAAAALVELSDKPVSGLLHVAGAERLTRLELGLAVLEARGVTAGEARRRVVPARRADVDAGAARPRDVSLDASRARAMLHARLPGARETLCRAG